MDDERQAMKLLHVITVPFSLFFFRGQAAFMKSKGVDFNVVASPGEALDRFGAREGVSVHTVPMVRQITPFKDIGAVRRLVTLIRDLRPDIVHAHTPKGGLLGMISSTIARVPVRIYHIRGLPHIASHGHRRLLLKRAEKLSCRLAHEVFCVSYSMRDIAVAEGLCRPEKIKVIRAGSGNGVDASGRFNPDRYDDACQADLRERLGLAPHDRVLGYVGRIVRDKGIEELSAAWWNLRERHQDLQLVLVGPIEPQDPISETTLQRLKMDDRVHFVGDLDDPAPWYSIFELVALPTYREGFPNVPLETASMGLPIVTTNVPGCVDAVIDGTTGTLVPPYDAHALEVALELYLDDPDLRRRHGFAGRERVLEEFHQEVIWEAIYQEYCRLLQERGIPLPQPSEATAAS
jgi:glycosyltransferase involved in cell wall biosynthesis